MQDGTLHKIPPVANINHLWNDLSSHTGKHIIARCTRNAEDGNNVTFNEDHKWRRAVAILAVCAIIMSVLGIVQLVSGNIAFDVRSILQLVIFVAAALRLSTEYIFMRNSGIIINKEGVKNTQKDSMILPWKEIVRVEKTELGVVLHTQAGKTFKISDRAENFFLFAHFLQNFLPPQCFNEDTAFPVSIRLDDSNFRLNVQLVRIYDIWSWEFVTCGLSEYDHKEISFTLRMETHETSNDLPSEIIDMFKWIYLSIAKGEQVALRNLTAFPNKGLLGREDWVGLVYAREEENLCALLATGHEYENAMLYGVQRILNRLGELYRYYPTISWNDRFRSPVAYKDEEPMNKPTVRFLDGVTTALYKDDRELEINFPTSMPTSGLPELLEINSENPKTFSVNTHTVPQADHALVWYPGQEGLFGISLPNSEKKITTACCAIFIPHADDDENIGLYEDGFVIFVRPKTYAQLISAISRQEQYEW